MLEKTFDPKSVEPRLYRKWEASGAFAPVGDAEAEPFSIVIPPPNVTGSLHIGHALNNTLQDVLVRRARLEGRSAVLVMNGQLDRKAMERESLSREELLSVIHRQGFEDFDQVRRCELEPNGTFYVEAFDPSAADKRHAELLERIDALSREVAALRVS